MKKLSVLLASTALLAAGGIAHAQTNTTTAQTPPPAPATTTTAPAPAQPVAPPAIDAITGKPVTDTNTADQKKDESLRDKVRSKIKDR